MISTDDFVENSSQVSNETWINNDPEFSLPNSVRFWLIVVFDVPSLICSFFLLYHLFVNKILRKALHNHVIMALLVVGLFSQLLDNPFYLNYLRIGYVWPRLPSSCFLWWFSATTISNLTNLLMAWASIERHILVFHSCWLSNMKKKLLLHYLPLVIIILYGCIYYTVIFLFEPCENLYAYDYDWCLYPCFYVYKDLALYDTIVNSIVPTPIIVIGNVFLLIRVVKKKQFLHRSIHWRKYRRMIIQLLSITALFLLFNLPMTSVILARTCGLLFGPTTQYEYYTYYLYRFVSILLPFICLTTIPELMKKLQKIFIATIRVNTVAAR